MMKTRRGTLSGTIVGGLALAGALAGCSVVADATTGASDEAEAIDTYTLSGDEGGSAFEGIAADEANGVFYVSETTGGEIHRVSVDEAEGEQWLEGDGADGRYTARGMTVDAEGRLYVAGGSNGIDNPDSPDFWVYDRDGELLASLQVPGDDAFLNDVVIGPDGAAYVTDSNDPRVLRVAETDGGWSAELWADGGGTISREEGFNLGGIEVTADGSAFIVAQGTTGQLWRFDAETGEAAEVATDGETFPDADGLLLTGDTLTIVQNFAQQVAELAVSADGTSAELIERTATDPERVLTTAAELDGETLFVDSRFDDEEKTPPYEIVTDPVGD